MFTNLWLRVIEWLGEYNWLFMLFLVKYFIILGKWTSATRRYFRRERDLCHVPVQLLVWWFEGKFLDLLKQISRVNKDCGNTKHKQISIYISSTDLMTLTIINILNPWKEYLVVCLRVCLLVCLLVCSMFVSLSSEHQRDAYNRKWCYIGPCWRQTRLSTYW